VLRNGSLRLLGWGAATVVLLLSLSILVPLINVITIILFITSLLVQYVKLDIKRFLIFYGICMVVVYLSASLLWMGSVAVFLMAVSLFFLPPIIQMGNQYKKHAPVRSVLTAGTVTLMAEILLSLLICYAIGINLFDFMEGALKDYFINSINTMPPELKKLMVIPDLEMIEQAVQVISRMFPLLMISVCFSLVLVTHWLSRKLLNKLGEKISGLKPVRNWMLHKSWVWYLVIALFMELLVKDMNSVFFTILINLYPLLIFIFAVQAVSLMLFVAHSRGWNQKLSTFVIIVILVVTAPFFMFLLSLLGVFDVAFPLRERITRK
jgi:uncharacterized protein YybS (DUF2232 family)